MTSAKINSVLPNSKGSALSVNVLRVGGVISELSSITLTEPLTEPQLLLLSSIEIM